jgi:hypothetical protein
MSHVRVAALLAALTLLVTGCSNAKKPVTLPVKAYEDLQYSTIDYLDKAIEAVKNSPNRKPGGQDGSETENQRQVDPAPCPQADNAFHVTGYDVVALAASAHRAVLKGIDQAWTGDGYSKVKDDPLDNGGADLVLKHAADDFTIEWSSSNDRTRLVVTVTSPCVIAPDGEYPH